MEDKNFVFCIYGFLRDMLSNAIDMDEITKFVYVPTKRYEDKDIEVTQQDLTNRFGKNSVIDTYEYIPQFYNEQASKLDVPKFNGCHQQPQRILSFFNHIKKSLELLEKSTDKYDDETIIFLFRSDIGIKKYDVHTARKLLNEGGDVLVENMSSNGVRDMFFVFKMKNIFIFKTLYESYKKYIVNFYKNQHPRPSNLTPESLIDFHIKNCNKKITPSPVIGYRFGHVCSQYCGHNKENTKILGEE
jgi:hypothetical protein|tara:strand:- start:1575 stop:2309 length:735 start_codon:yes stop_codon:yes gene_type:complete